MLRKARAKLPAARLALADLRRLPFAGAFGGALCLESPLAYLLDDGALDAALKGIRRVLERDARLLIDVYDYLGTFGAGGLAPQAARFESDGMQLLVRESHGYEKRARLWTMRQQFEVEEAGERFGFEVVHRLRMRTLDEYAAALEAAGFVVLEALPAYPHAPAGLDERRLILVGRCKAAQPDQGQDGGA